MGLVRLVSVLFFAGFAAACASGGGVPKPFPGAPVPEPPNAPAAPSTPALPSRLVTSADPGAVVQTALRFRGVPYRNGGTDPSGFDCSGLVQYVFAQHGVSLPREVREQFTVGTDVRVAG